LAPTVGIAPTGFYYPGGILQLFHREDQANFAATNSSSQITSREINLRLWRQAWNYLKIPTDRSIRWFTASLKKKFESQLGLVRIA
jgi:hypothetical protein